MISVVVPAFNEVDAIEDTIAELREMFAKAELNDAEIVVVDDGSTDGTADLAEKAGVKVVRHPMNAGYGRSLKDGIGAAKHDIIAITDADGTYPNHMIPELLARLDRGFHMVVGARTGEAYRESALKQPLRTLLRWLVEFTAGQAIPDPNSGLRVFRKSDIVGFFPHLSNAFSFTTSSTLGYMMTGLFVHYVPIPYAKRIGKSKVKLFRDSLRTLQYILQAILYYNPLKLFLVFCAVLTAASLLSFVLAIVLNMTVWYFLGVGGILAAILVAAIGCLAELLRQIMAK
jgi:polyisoprenyl-phosphate glycosyltransferase